MVANSASTYMPGGFEALFKKFLADPVKLIEELTPIDQVKDVGGRTLLHLLAITEHGHHLMDHIIRLGADPNATSSEGFTPLHNAAFYGNLAAAEVLVRAGASVDAKDAKGRSAIDYAMSRKQEDVARFLMKLQTDRVENWSIDSLRALCDAGMIGLIHDYFDHFRIILDPWKRDCETFVRYRNLHQVYGIPDQPVASTTLSIVLQYPDISPDILSHGLMTYIMNAKWHVFARRRLVKEGAVYIILLVATYVSLAFKNQDTHREKIASQVLQGTALVCSAILLVTKELRELWGQGGSKYFSSKFNWLNLWTYVLVIVAIVLNVLDGTASTRADICMAIAIVLLCLSAMEYLRLAPITDVLVAMMLQMIRDVLEFTALYVAFLVGFSGAFYILLAGRPRFENYSNSIIATFFMLFGDFGPDTFLGLDGSRWIVANVLLNLYLMSVLVMLLNILIAMMSTRYEEVKNRAYGERNRAKAEAIVRIESVLPIETRIKAYNSLIRNFRRRFTQKVSKRSLQLVKPIPSSREKPKPSSVESPPGSERSQHFDSKCDNKPLGMPLSMKTAIQAVHGGGILSSQALAAIHDLEDVSMDESDQSPDVVKDAEDAGGVAGFGIPMSMKTEMKAIHGGRELSPPSPISSANSSPRNSEQDRPIRDAKQRKNSLSSHVSSAESNPEKKPSPPREASNDVTHLPSPFPPDTGDSSSPPSPTVRKDSVGEAIAPLNARSAEQIVRDALARVNGSGSDGDDVKNELRAPERTPSPQNSPKAPSSVDSSLPSTPRTSKLKRAPSSVSSSGETDLGDTNGDFDSLDFDLLYATISDKPQPLDSKSTLDYKLRYIDTSLFTLRDNNDYTLDDVTVKEYVGAPLPVDINRELQLLKDAVMSIQQRVEHSGALEERTFIRRMTKQREDMNVQCRALRSIHADLKAIKGDLTRLQTTTTTTSSPSNTTTTSTA